MNSLPLVKELLENTSFWECESQVQLKKFLEEYVSPLTLTKYRKRREIRECPSSNCSQHEVRNLTELDLPVLT